MLTRVASAVGLWFALGGVLVQAASFHSLGPTDEYFAIPGFPAARPSVSGDGSTVAYASGASAFTWTVSGGAQQLPGQSAYPTALSHDGSVVVGQSGLPDGGWRPTWWEDGAQSVISWIGGRGTDVSADGSVMVGTPAFRAIKTAGQDLTLSGLSSVAGVSGDGQIVAANGKRTYSPGDFLPQVTVPTAHTWQNWVVTDLGSLTEGIDRFSYAQGISADGSVVVGYSSSNSLFREAFRWTADGGMVGLGSAHGWDGAYDQTWMMASDADGSVLVGTAYHGDAQNPFREQRAIMWNPQGGIRFLDEVLAQEFGIDLEGWQLKEASGISDDGKTIVGWGVGPQGEHEGFVFIVPEPAGLLLLAGIGGLVVVRRGL